MTGILEKIERYVLYATVFLIPLSFFYISPNPFVVSKLAVLVAGLSLFFIVRSIRIITTGKLDFVSGTFDVAALVLLVAYVLSAALRTTNKMEALLLPGTATIVAGSALLYFAINQLDKPGKRLVSFSLVLSGAFFALLILVSATGLLGKITMLPAYMQSRGFTPEGGYLPSAIFLLALVPLAMGFALSHVNRFKVAGFVAGGFVLIGLLFSLYNIVPGRPWAPRFLSYQDSWNIAVDSLKVSPLMGIGPGNYLTAFNRFRPVTYNATDLWAIKFSTARSAAMTMVTEAGFLALLGVIILAFGTYKMIAQAMKDKPFNQKGLSESSTVFALTLMVVSILFAPTTLTLVVALFILMSLSSKTKEFGVSLTGKSNDDEEKFSWASRLPAFIITLPLLGAVVYSDIFAAKVLVAENTFKNSIDALARNEASNTYDTMRKAIALNPRVDRYRISFSRVNLVLANAVAAKQDITDEDRKNITTLVQQSISEAKAGVALNPLRAGNWEGLAQVYRAIAPLAKGSDDFAAQSYRQAIILDPTNPQLRIALGGIYFAKQDYENAVKVFELAVAAKQDHANARYNLAVALEQNKQIDAAITQMNNVLSLVKKDSKDYEVAAKALEALKAKKTTAAESGDELTAPEKAQAPKITPAIELPEDSKPPESPISVTPTQTPVSPTVTAAPSPTPAQ